MCIENLGLGLGLCGLKQGLGLGISLFPGCSQHRGIVGVEVELGHEALEL